MKTLYLVRHGKSSWDYPDLTDFERPLNTRGKRDAPFMGKLLKEKNIYPDLILSSPALRAYFTARIIAEKINYPSENIETSEIIYESDAKGLISFIRSFPGELNSVMIFGHNPALTLLNNYLSDKRLDNIPTCAVAGISFDVDVWEEINTGGGKFLFIEKPKDYLKKK